MLKYDNKVRDIPSCPPHSCGEAERAGVRYVFARDMPRSFLPPLSMKPERALTMEDINRCDSWALSFFVSAEQARELFERIRKNSKNIHKKMGDSLARGEIAKSDGLCGEVDAEGHFSLHEYETARLDEKFVTFESLI
jgi:hypothetical protein